MAQDNNNKGNQPTTDKRSINESTTGLSQESGRFIESTKTNQDVSNTRPPPDTTGGGSDKKGK